MDDPHAIPAPPTAPHQPEPPPRSDQPAQSDQPAWPSTDPEVPSATLWAFTLSDQMRAQEALLASLRLASNNHLTIEDAAIASRDERGKVRLIQTRDVTPAQGAISGSWWGLLAGLFTPLPLVGVAIGAAAGGLFAKLRDHGIDDDEMRTWGESLAPGQAALFLLVEDCHQARALHEVGRFEATLLTTTAPDELAHRVRDRLAVDPWAGI